MGPLLQDTILSVFVRGTWHGVRGGLKGEGPERVGGTTHQHVRPNFHPPSPLLLRMGVSPHRKVTFCNCFNGGYPIEHTKTWENKSN